MGSMCSINHCGGLVGVVSHWSASLGGLQGGGCPGSRNQPGRQAPPTDPCTKEAPTAACPLTPDADARLSHPPGPSGAQTTSMPPRCGHGPPSWPVSPARWAVGILPIGHSAGHWLTEYPRMEPTVCLLLLCKALGTDAGKWVAQRHTGRPWGGFPPTGYH